MSYPPPIGWFELVGLGAFSLSFVLSIVIFSLLLRRPNRLLALDAPSGRGLHQRSTPRGGGIVITLVVGLTALLLITWGGSGWSGVGLGLALSGISVIGFVDDHRSLTVRFRLLSGFGLMAVVLAFSIEQSTWLVFGSNMNWPLAIVFLPALLLMVWFVNLFNFMDGADGLAALQALIAAFVLACWFAISGQLGLSVLNFSLAGAVASFVCYNWAPARIFLGDAGSLGLGAWFACMGVIGATTAGFPLEAFFVLLGYFWFDATLTLVCRLFSGKKLSEPHREHLYQRLILSGRSHRWVALLTGGINLLLASIACCIVYYPQYSLMFALGAFLLLSFFSGWILRSSSDSY